MLEERLLSEGQKDARDFFLTEVDAEWDAHNRQLSAAVPDDFGSTRGLFTTHKDKRRKQISDLEKSAKKAESLDDVYNLRYEAAKLREDLARDYIKQQEGFLNAGTERLNTLARDYVASARPYVAELQAVDGKDDAVLLEERLAAYHEPGFFEAAEREVERKLAEAESTPAPADGGTEAWEAKQEAISDIQEALRTMSARAQIYEMQRDMINKEAADVKSLRDSISNSSSGIATLHEVIEGYGKLQSAALDRNHIAFNEAAGSVRKFSKSDIAEIAIAANSRVLRAEDALAPIAERVETRIGVADQDTEARAADYTNRRFRYMGWTAVGLGALGLVALGYAMLANNKSDKTAGEIRSIGATVTVQAGQIGGLEDTVNKQGEDIAVIKDPAKGYVNPTPAPTVVVSPTPLPTVRPTPRPTATATAAQPTPAATATSPAAAATQGPATSTRVPAYTTTAVVEYKLPDNVRNAPTVNLSTALVKGLFSGFETGRLVNALGMSTADIGHIANEWSNANPADGQLLDRNGMSATYDSGRRELRVYGIEGGKAKAVPGEGIARETFNDLLVDFARQGTAQRSLVENGAVPAQR